VEVGVKDELEVL